MLKAADIPLFQKLLVHGHWVSSGSKMSKSLGNVVDPLVMRDHIGEDAVRYFLLRDMSFGEDANFTEDSMIARYNSDLANNLGNLLSRSLNLSCKHFNNSVPAKGTLSDLEISLDAAFQEGIKDVRSFILNFKLHKAIESIMMMSDQVNKYLDETKPWKLSKSPENRGRLGTVLYTSLESTRILLELLAPVMPEKVKEARELLGSTPSKHLEDILMHSLQEGSPLQQPKVLFPRFKNEQKASMTETQTPPSKENPTEKSTAPEKDEQTSQITIDDFAKVELRVGQILSSEKVEKADRLLHSQVDLGEEKPRSIVSGIAKFYSPEDLPGKKVVVVSNLKPAKLRGILSEGMILCADGEEGALSLVEPPQNAPIGSLIR